MEILEQPKHQCVSCGCVYTFGKKDFIECSYHIYVECPVCGTKHIIMYKK